MKLKSKPEIIKKWEYAWYWRWCEDTFRWVWLERVWVVKHLDKYTSRYLTYTYENHPDIIKIKPKKGERK